MKDEIKEILEYLHRCELLGKNQILTNEEIKLLLQHITNLQEERNDYKDRFNLMAKFRDKALAREWDYKSRNEKAVEFIKEKISSTKGVIDDYMYHKEHNKHLIELLNEDIEMYKNELNILNGGDNNE